MGTSSMWRTQERVSEGYCMTATCWVSPDSSRTVRSTMSSRSTAPVRNSRIAARSAGDRGLISESWSTKSR